MLSPQQINSAVRTYYKAVYGEQQGFGAKDKLAGLKESVFWSGKQVWVYRYSVKEIAGGTVYDQFVWGAIVKETTSYYGARTACSSAPPMAKKAVREVISDAAMNAVGVATEAAPEVAGSALTAGLKPALKFMLTTGPQLQRKLGGAFENSMYNSVMASQNKEQQLMALSMDNKNYGFFMMYVFVHDHGQYPQAQMWWGERSMGDWWKKKCNDPEETKKVVAHCPLVRVSDLMPYSLTNLDRSKVSSD